MGGTRDGGCIVTGGTGAEGAHPETISWNEHVEEVGRVRAELTAEAMRLEALLDERNRELDSLRERLPPSAAPWREPAKAAPASPALDASRAAASARALRLSPAGRRAGAPSR